MITFSAFADEVSTDFLEQLRFLQSQQIPYIELRFVNKKNSLDLNRDELAEAKKMLDDHGIKVSAIASPIGKVKIDEPFAPHFDRYKHAVELAHYFNTSLLRIFSYYAPATGEPIENFREEVMERMAQKAAYLKGTFITMVHENESHIYGHSAENCVDMVKTVNSPHLRLAYDPANFVWGDNITDNVDRCWPLMQPYVAHIHIKDWKLGSKDVGAMPGEGDGQIDTLLKAVAEMQYAGFITMEPHLYSGGQFGGVTTPEQYVEAIAKTRAICKKYRII
jgi:sugar phosphate isomerase/epimerase